MAISPIYLDRHGNGNIGRFAWVNSDTRRTCSSWTFWGDWWWDTSGERRPTAYVENTTPELSADPTNTTETTDD
jgi:hypothetical protein